MNESETLLEELRRLIASAQKAFLSVDEAAEYTGLSRTHLNKLRRDGEGPPFIVLSRRIIYRRSAIDDWLISREVQP